MNANWEIYVPRDEPEAPTRYTTRRDAIEQAILPALDSDQYDLEAICYEAFDWRIDVNDQGQELLHTGGFEQTVTTEEFWEIVARHELTGERA